MSIARNIFEIAVNIWESFLVMYFIFKFMEVNIFNRKNIIKYIFGSLIHFSMVTYINYLIPYEGLIYLVIVAVVFLFQLVFLKGSVIKKLYSSILYFLCLLLISSTTVGIVAYLFNTTAEAIYSDFTYVRIITVLLVQILLAVSYIMIIHFTKKSSVFFNKSEWLVIFSVFLASVFIMFFIHLFRMSYDISSKSNFLFNVVNLSILGMNFGLQYMIYNINRKSKKIQELEINQQRLQYQSIYAENIQQQANVVSRIRHDLKQHMTILSIMISEGKLDEARQYMQNYQTEVIPLESHINMENPYLEALINVKFTSANKNNIQVYFTCQAELRAYSDVALCNLIGNLLDNAIEACQKTEDSKIIQLSIIGNEDRLMIVCANSVKDPDNITFKTTKANPHEHGFGIKTIKSIVKQYDGDFSSYMENNLFHIQIVLYGK